MEKFGLVVGAGFFLRKDDKSDLSRFLDEERKKKDRVPEFY